MRPRRRAGHSAGEGGGPSVMSFSHGKYAEIVSPTQTHRPTIRSMPGARSLFETIWRDHVVTPLEGDTDLVAIDRHFVHEVSSAEAFRQLAASGRGVAQPAQTFAVQDHIVSTRPG